MSASITEDDWIKPLVMVRDVAQRLGFDLPEEDEQWIVAGAVEAMTNYMADGIAGKLGRTPRSKPDLTDPYTMRDIL